MFSYCERSAYRALFVLRVVLGVIFLTHGVSKLTHMDATMAAFAGLGLSPATTLAVTAVETLGGTALIVGALTRLAALGIAVVMLGAVITVHAKNGFFIDNHGYEYNLALLAICTALMMGGSGPLSIDQIFARFQKTKLQRHSYNEREGS